MDFSDKYVCLAVAGSFLFGYQIAIMNSVLSWYHKVVTYKGDNENLNLEAESVINFESLILAMLFLGACCGSLAAGKMLDRGRRFSMLIMHFISIIGAVLCCFASSGMILIFGRFIVGVCIGLVTVVTPTFISEITTTKKRGSRGALHQLILCVGILCSLLGGLSLNGLVSDSNTEKGYSYGPERILVRVMHLVPAVVSGVTIIFMKTIFLSDTPRSLLNKNEPKECLNVLYMMYGCRDVAEMEYESYTARDFNDCETVGMKGIFSRESYWKTVLIGIVLSMSQQLSGINAFFSMSNNIFMAAGMETWLAPFASLAMGFVNVITTFPAILLIDSIGRKPLYIIGTVGQTLSLSLVPIMYFSTSGQSFALITAVSVISFIIFFGVAQGPVLWVYLFEMFPSEIKSFGTSMSSATNWLTGGMVVYLNSILSSQFYLVPKFAVFTLCSLLSGIFIIIFLKETKGCTNSPYEKELDTVEDVNEPLI